jgi:hypothetical protein
MGRPTTFIISAAAGIAFGVLFLLAAFLPGPPPAFNATGNEVVAFYQAHGAAQAWANFIEGLAVIALLGFLPALRSILTIIEGESGFAWTVTMAGLIGGTGAALAGTGMFEAQALNAATLQGPSAVLLMEAAARNARNFTYFPIAAAIGSTSWCLLSSRGITRWMGWFGMLAALLLLVSTLIFVFQAPAIRLLGLAALFGFGGWFLLLGAALSLKASRGQPPVSIR